MSPGKDGAIGGQGAVHVGSMDDETPTQADNGLSFGNGVQYSVQLFKTIRMLMLQLGRLWQTSSLQLGLLRFTERSWKGCSCHCLRNLRWVAQASQAGHFYCPVSSDVSLKFLSTVRLCWAGSVSVFRRFTARWGNSGSQALEEVARILRVCVWNKWKQCIMYII